MRAEMDLEMIRCPMCGHSNPPDAEVCQVCQARLTPLTQDATAQPPSEPPAETDGSQWQALGAGEDRSPLEPPVDEDALQWLQDLRPRQKEDEWRADFQEEESSPFPEGRDAQEWLDRLRQRPTQEKQPSSELGALPEDWSYEFQTADEQETADWLAGIEGEKEQAEKEAESLPSAGLPTWLEAMRPAEVAAQPPTDDNSLDYIESAGPLAGLRGILAAEPEVARPQRSPAFPSFLQVSEKQRTHAELLKALLEQEGEAQPPPRAKVLQSGWLRTVIAVLLVVALLLPIAFASQISPLPINLPEVFEISRLIESLPEQAAVLVAFDYEPGLSAEMDAAASAVLDHLMLRGARLAVLSTSPHGTILAERFIQTIQAFHRYRSGQEYVNLGYVPGGIAGLSSLTAELHRSLPFTLQGSPAWSGTAPLQNVSRLTDFSLVMVIADNPDDARAWIEQVQPTLQAAEVPMVMVLSAQAEPLVRPYYEATPRQVAGLVVGMRGGAAYARLSGRGGLARMYWDTFSLGLLMAGAILLLGSFLQTLLLWQSRSRGKREARSP